MYFILVARLSSSILFLIRGRLNLKLPANTCESFNYSHKLLFASDGYFYSPCRRETLNKLRAIDVCVNLNEAGTRYNIIDTII